MKLGNPFKMIGKETQQMMIGGLVGSLSYYADLAVSTQSWYPNMLKSRVIPQLPRNDELLTSIAPPAAMWFIAKKKPKLKDVAKGTMMYSAPHLMQRVVMNAVKPATASAVFMFTPTFVAVSPASSASKIYPPPTPVESSVSASPVGKYR